ncbi:MAG: hypothetical protein EA001_03710 [Oscillatoriales cyanobacterium]|nr:MAG: hypothetical protein EA001_03710 [Oscillatoriales cyanobacterium]
MSSGIYLVRNDGRLVEMTEQPYGSVTLIQELLENHPNLLAGDRSLMARDQDWLAIVRQGTNSFDDDRADRWSLDRIFLDRQGVPTVVEVFCNQDEAGPQSQGLIGQAIEYAANLSQYWPIEAMLAQFEASCRANDRDPDQAIEEFLGHDESEEERFWQQVKTHLQAGRIRIVVVSDALSPELVRTVEFLNAQMDPAEVQAIELRQYVSDEGFCTLVPRSIGRMADSKNASPALDRRRWDEESFFQEFTTRQGEDEAAIAHHIYEWCSDRTDVEVYWRTGDAYGGFVAMCDFGRGESHELFKVGIDGGLEINSSAYASWYPFTRHEEWMELRNHLSSIGLALPPDSRERRAPNFSLSTLRDDQSMQQVFETFSWVIDRARQGLSDTKRRSSDRQPW